MRLSIIVPIYNVEQWLNRCLDSLYKQELSEEEFELILVNDGSTDSSLSIAETFASHHSNVRVVNRKNGGASAARNTGLEYAQGDYVWFVDGDDFIERASIKALLNYAIDNNLDVMCFNLHRFYEDGRKCKYKNPEQVQNRIMTGEEFVCIQHMPAAPWAALYSVKFLSEYNLRFIEGITLEDEEFTSRAYFLSRRISYKDIVVVNYFQRFGSTMKSSMSELRVTSCLKICDSFFEIMRSRVNPGSEAYEFFKRRLLFCFSQGLSHLSKCESRDLQQFKSKPYYPLASPKNLTLRPKIKLFLINHFPMLYVKMLQVKNK